MRLVVPAVEPGDIGLVMAVHELEWDGGFRRWWVTAAEDHRYVLPGELHSWARRLDHDLRRRHTRLPTVFAFSKQGQDIAALRLSMA